MSLWHVRAGRGILMALALSGAVIAVPAAAQSDDFRLRKMESEIQALQRKVFPGGDGKYFVPEVVTPGSGAPTPAQAQPVGTPSAGALTDVLARLDSIEAQLNQLTARSEVTENALSKLQARVDALEAHNAQEAAAAPPAQPVGAIPVPDEPKPLPKTTAATRTSSKAKAASGQSDERLAKVRAVVKPQTDDAGDDEYSYGFHLWQAGLYPEAEQQLKLYVDKYPSHREISYGRNLLGRAYLDDNQPREAATYFLENYQKDPGGARAGDSLLFLADAMMALKDNTRACRALAEFADKYPALAAGRLQGQYDKDRKQAGCK